MKKVFVFLVILVVTICLMGESKSKPVRLKIGQRVVEVEIADTSAKREQGLSDQKSLCENCGLLFLFDQPGIYPFWMRRMYFDIDIIWVWDNKVVEITYGAKVPPPDEIEVPKTRYQSRVMVDSVLEVNAGWAERNRVKIGDLVEKL